MSGSLTSLKTGPIQRVGCDPLRGPTRPLNVPTYYYLLKNINNKLKSIGFVSHLVTLSPSVREVLTSRREGLGAFIFRADDKIRRIGHLVYTQIPLGPRKNCVATLFRKRYSRSSPNFHDKMSRALTWFNVKKSGYYHVTCLSKKIISKKTIECGQYSLKTRYVRLSWRWGRLWPLGALGILRPHETKVPLDNIARCCCMYGYSICNKIAIGKIIDCSRY